MIRILKSFHRTHEYITHDDTSNNHIVLVDMGKWFDRVYEGNYAECLAFVRCSQKCPDSFLQAYYTKEHEKEMRACRNI